MDLVISKTISMAKSDLKAFGGSKYRTQWGDDATDCCKICQDKEETETVEHVLCHCPTLFGEGHKLMEKQTLDDLFSFFDNESTLQQFF